jgi:hypothetical protein
MEHHNARKSIKSYSKAEHELNHTKKRVVTYQAALKEKNNEKQRLQSQIWNQNKKIKHAAKKSTTLHKEYMEIKARLKTQAKDMSIAHSATEDAKKTSANRSNLMSKLHRKVKDLTRSLHTQQEWTSKMKKYAKDMSHSPLISNGAFSPEARSLIHCLVRDGVPYWSVGKVVYDVSKILGQPLKRAPSPHSVQRIVLEALEAGKLQLALEINSAEGLQNMGIYIMILNNRLWQHSQQAVMVLLTRKHSMSRPAL